jgi:Tfp pilus assembly protein PilP
VLPRSSPECLGVITAVVVFSLIGCSSGGAPSSPLPARPPQPVAAKPATPEPVATPGTAAAPPPFVYEAKGRRDPFRPLIAPRVVEPRTRPKIGLAALEVNELKLAGIIWEPRGFFALVEAPNGAGYVLRPNDIVGEDARVTKITAEVVTFEVKGAILAPQAQARARIVELRLRKEE